MTSGNIPGMNRSDVQEGRKMNPEFPSDFLSLLSIRLTGSMRGFCLEGD
ncbi:MAG: hypothetical protein HXS41_12320 [Theionarchaea archaeon]|nr:hypothetical protein [Theionarchaea archaeon]MBU6999359.1 hypothetical protein [Theionarchaea archaeon]MBU7021837.1 hypothetical protein [Theionarchaea archaeon]